MFSWGTGHQQHDRCFCHSKSLSSYKWTTKRLLYLILEFIDISSWPFFFVVSSKRIWWLNFTVYMELGVLDVSVTKGASNCITIQNPLVFWAPIWDPSIYRDFGSNFFAWYVCATGFELALLIARVIWTTWPKPAFGLQGLDWIVRPEYSFGVFWISHFGWAGGVDKTLQRDRHALSKVGGEDKTLQNTVI